MSRIIARVDKHRPPPAESPIRTSVTTTYICIADSNLPASTILDGGMALCNAFGGGLIKYRSNLHREWLDYDPKGKNDYMQLEHPATGTAMGIAGLF